MLFCWSGLAIFSIHDLFSIADEEIGISQYRTMTDFPRLLLRDNSLWTLTIAL